MSCASQAFWQAFRRAISSGDCFQDQRATVDVVCVMSTVLIGLSHKSREKCYPAKVFSCYPTGDMRRGRKPYEAGRKRTVAVLVKMRPDEREAIGTRAAVKGKGVATYLRDSALPPNYKSVAASKAKAS